VSKFLLVAILFGALSAPLALADTFEEVGEDASQVIVNKYLVATKAQQTKLRGMASQVKIVGQLPKLAKTGNMTALRQITRIGKIAYKPLGFQGDDTIKKEVIARFLSAETEEKDNGPIAITPDNYRFKLKNTANLNGRKTYVLALTPKRKAVGLFKGELWLDAETSMPVRETGQFVKNPSLFLKKVSFVRDYAMNGDVSFPSHLESIAETRLFGKAELEIDYSEYAYADDTGDAAN